MENLITPRESGPEPGDLGFPPFVQELLELGVEGAFPEAPPVHQGEDLDIPDRVQPEAFRDALGDHPDQSAEDLLGVWAGMK